jgi:uncharacterized membrane protein
MNQLKPFMPTLVFYVVSFAVVYILTLISPNQQDGGPGFGTLALVLLVLIMLILAVINLVKAFRSEKGRLTLAWIHLIILAIMITTLVL